MRYAEEANYFQTTVHPVAVFPQMGQEWKKEGEERGTK